MKKGFTLVELLAVIIILGVLSLLIVPKVINTLNDSEEKTNMASAEGLLKAAEFKYQDNEINGISESILVDYTNNINTDVLDFNGKKPEKGQVIIRTNGQVGMFAKIGEKCYSKNYNSSEITITPYNEETCGQSIKIVTSGDGLYESTTEPGRLLYKGANPNNYINIKEDGINNTLYRIFSYEPDGTIKVVRDDRISKNGKNVIEFDENNSRRNENNTYCTATGTCNVWGNQNTTLHDGIPLGNSFYYIYYDNSSSQDFTNGESGTVTSDSTLNTYLNSTWITTFLDNYIESHSWNVGGVNETNYKPLLKAKQEEQQLQWIGKVGLLTITEYAEASTNSQCTSIQPNITQCNDSNWTVKNYFQWSLSASSSSTPNSTAQHVWVMYSTTILHFHSGRYTDVSVHPAFYLKSSVKLGGTGTESDPYYLID